MFISIQSLRSCFPTNLDLTSESGKETAIQFVGDKAQNGTLLLNEKNYPIEEVVDFIRSLSIQQIVFLEWIDQHNGLVDLLNNKTPNAIFTDSQNWQGHTLFPAFQVFLSPLLLPKLIRFKETPSFTDLRIAFSFARLLTESDRIFIEQQLFKPIQDTLTTCRVAIENAENEQTISNLIQPFCSDEMVDSINFLSRSSYASKLFYIDWVLWVIRQKACTVRLANWLLKQLEKIELNPEHLEKIAELKQDLREGRIRVKNTNIQRRYQWSFRSLIGAGMLAGLIGLVIWLIIYQPFSSVNDDIIQTSTSFEQFSKDERQKIDSLLREVEQRYNPDLYDSSNYSSILGNGVSLAIRVPFKNQRMEQLYTDFLLDADLQSQGLYDTSNVYTSKEANKKYYNGVSNFASKQGKVKTMIKNESAYDVYFIVFNNFKQGSIHSALIAKGTTIEVQLTKDEQMLFIPGNKLGKVIAPKSTNNIPSSTFDHHFTKTDMNYLEALNNVYFLSAPQTGTNKLLLTGDKGTYFTVIDLYGILELF